MRAIRHISEFLASPEIETAQAARFDEMYELASDEARATLDRYIETLKAVKYMGDISAKFLLMRLYDYLNLDEVARRQARKQGEWLLSIQEYKGEQQ